MLTFILLILIGIGVFLWIKGSQGKSKSRVVIGLVTATILILLFWLMDFWGEKLWFDALGYSRRFWTSFWAHAGMAAVGALVSTLFSLALLFFIPKDKKLLRYAVIVLAFLIGGVWGASNWDTTLKWWYGVQTGLSDPILHTDTGFYLFSLPFYDNLQGLLLTLAVITLIASVIINYRIERVGNQFQFSQLSHVEERKINNSIYLNGGILILLAAIGKYLARFHLLYSHLGVVSGPGWTDVNIILPTYNGIIIITALLGIILFIPAGRKLLQRFVAIFRINIFNSALLTVGVAAGFMLIIWLLGLTLIPDAFQGIRVEPNEISYEKPYIANNIKFTRYGFKLNTIEEKEFPVVDSFSRNMVTENESIFNNIRLWDWRALEAVLKQFQEIRLYYQFNDVDIDRYHYNGEYRQVMVSAREMNIDNLPENSQTFVNRVFKYTHGNGIALSTVTDFTPEGLPNLLLKNIPPESKYSDLKVTQPRIYYGEITNHYVIANSTEQEFDYPQGEENVYTRYNGSGGVLLSNAWRKLIYAYKLGDINLLLSSYPTKDSKILFDRQIVQRVKKLAPFLELDKDPYIVNADGNLYWMIDAYTTSSYFPYSEPFSSWEDIQYKDGGQEKILQTRHNPAFEGINYIRNAVKITVNAYNGDVKFYIFDEEDPLIKVWDKIFPGLLQQKSAMPKALLAHIRYPADFLLTQGVVYAKYHMTDPEVFYNQEDLWIRATETYYGEVQPVDPYYIMWQLPGSKSAEFSLILPFTPKNRQVSIGWIAGLCDPNNYGRFLAYNFPKEKRVLGPQQVETKIDQNSFLSGQLTLWDQRGSRVIRGNVLAIPVENTIIYVEPIYLQAETAAYPELRLVCVMHDDNLSYAQTFDEALQGLFGGAPTTAPSTETATTTPAKATIQQANQAFNDYINATGQGRLEDAGRALQQLKNALQQLSKQAEAPQDTLQK